MRTQRIPVRLRKEPLLEAFWEMRFAGSSQAVSELLPGMLFKAFQGKYTNLVKLPTSNIPIQVADKDQNLRYAPRLRLENMETRQSRQDNALSL